MKFDYKFQHILTLKEREKEETYSLYEESVRQFERAAKNLYELLKKKEVLEQFQSEKLETGFSIQKIRHHQLFINNLEETIDYWQKQVMATRNEMKHWEEKLLESNIEVKKYEKMKDKSYKYFQELINTYENNQMDEIAAIQFQHRKGN
ncbi:flagellar export protein FliJ [Siminovitchia fortis]|uniref:Flagellar FliJ protein n=1 Tax=Siminovitchia fortis TaxID=254758 RepID=A0A443J0Z3_9BACI|nr:flagellar export protein FliJ [Siminovitchia fortis]RWR14124.1 flagellar biosynthesis chaperone FliJ [Siminovitchia fortis]WHY83306.1 flagellar export protein FliJ [Siminovitchia fortis]